jgi:hypothetical protein
MEDPKKIAIAILGKGARPASQPVDELEGEGEDDEGTMVAETLIDAVKAGDSAAVMSAFEALYDHCAMKRAGESDESDEEYEEG